MAFRRLVLHLAAVHYAVVVVVVVSRPEQTSVGKQCDVCVVRATKMFPQMQPNILH